jgi:hypothetical protein
MKHRFLHIALNIAVLLASSSTLLAAEKTAPPKPDPILADLTTKVDAQWRAEWLNGALERLPPSLHIAISIRGTAAAQANEYGEIRLDSVLDENGKSYRWQCLPCGRCLQDMTAVIHPQIGTNKDGLNLEFQIRNRPRIKTIRELRGSVAVETGGEFEKIVVQNAFKKLGDPAKGEADPHDSGTLIRDNRLNELGGTLNMARGPIPKWNQNAKDCIRVSIDSSQLAVTKCELLDAKGNAIPDTGRHCSISKPYWYFNFETTVVVPADAQLRLTIQKNTRKVRIPFVAKDINVPEPDKEIDVPASKQDAYVEAETLPADSPICAGLRLNARADWRQWADNFRPPCLGLRVELRGETARQISAWGEFDIESAIDDAGRSLIFPSAHAEMQVRFFDSDAIDVDSELSSSPPKREIRELRGSMSLQIGDPSEIVTVKSFLNNFKKDKSLDAADLSALGIAVTLKERENVAKSSGGVDGIRLEVHWKRNSVALCQICDAEGATLARDSLILSYLGPTSVSFWSTFEKPLPSDAQLKLQVQKNTRKIRVPFVFKNINIPPIPTR